MFESEFDIRDFHSMILIYKYLHILYVTAMKKKCGKVFNFKAAINLGIKIRPEIF